MVFLLDTHVLLWALDKPDRLPEEVLNYLETPDNEVYFSPVSILEIAIKTSLGRVNFSYSPEQIMQVAQETGNCLLLPSMPPKLPNCLHIIDPFDRLLIAQTLLMPTRLLTADSALTPYSELVWLI